MVYFFNRYCGIQYRNSSTGHSRLDSSITRIPRIVEDDDPYSEVVIISNSRLSLSDPSSLNNNSSRDHSSLVSVLRSDLGDVAIGGQNLVHVVCERPLEPSGTLDSQYLGPPPSYGSLTLESPPSYYGAIRMQLYDWMMQKQ